MARRGGADMMGGSRGNPGGPNVEGGGGGHGKGKGKPEMSTSSWRALSPREKMDFFGGVRPGSVKKKKLTAKQKRDAERGSY